MPIECPRCSQTNTDSSLICECGYDLAPQLRQHQVDSPTSATDAGPTPPALLKEMRRRDFLLWIGVIWIALSVGEWVWIRLHLSTRPAFELLKDSLLMGLTDLAGALFVGSLGWVGVWFLLAYEGSPRSLCPKRVALSVTFLAASFLFIVARVTGPAVLTQHLIHGLLLFAIAGFSYYAGSRGWFGKW